MLQITKENIGTFLNKFSTNELEDMVQQFPYFQQAHILLAKKYQQENNPQFDEQLQLAALYAGNRELLQSLFSISDLPLTEVAQLNESMESVSLEETVSNPNFKVEEMVATEEVLATKVEVVEENVLDEIVNLSDEQPEPVRLTVADKQEEAIEVSEENPSTQNEKVFVSPELVEPEKVDQVLTDSEIVEAPQVEEISTSIITVEQSIDLSQPHSFNEWLSVFNSKSRSDKNDVIEKVSADEPDDELDHLIRTGISVDLLHNLVQEETHYSKGLDLFIESQKDKHKLSTVSKTSDENEIDASLVTETLARLYEAQKKYHKAINAYKALTLKYPEKSDLFAARINYLKNII
jgi:hypothetical protein